MNYDHAFHAGNHADVLKHLVLWALLDALGRKPAPYFVLDTHAGQGHYPLRSGPALRTNEAESGILRLRAWAARGSKLAPALQDYLRAVRPYLDQDHYPGSPQLVVDAMRENDHLACCELQPEAAAKLKARFRREPRVGVHQRDGYEAIKALLPPAQKRGLVLIDPPYEAQLAEFEQILKTLRAALTCWPQGIVALWYPIKRRRDLQPFLRRAAALPTRSTLLIELLVHPDDSPLRLNGSGLLLLNPPWQLDLALADALPQLARALADDSGQSRLQWLRNDAQA